MFTLISDRDWFAHVDIYCERLGPGLWAEPLNALSNLAFILAAIIVWPHTKGLPLARVLAVNLFIIGVGSGLFHTFANTWSSTADVVPILAYILIYIFATTTRIFNAPWWGGVLAVLLYFPFAYLVGQAVTNMFGTLNGSVQYIPVVLLLIGYGIFGMDRDPKAATGILIGAGILAVSVTFRTFDHAVCHALPIGIHYVWHCLNALMLGWMIVVYARMRRPVAF